jgi:hypothetical protein
MLRRFTSGLLTLVLFGTLAGGAALGRGGAGGDCPMARMSGMHDCCKRARSKARTPGLAAAQLCCLVNCPQSAPTGTNFTYRTSADASTSPRLAVTAQTPSLRPDAHAREYSPPFQSSHSPPAYIQHSAFLI